MLREELADFTSGGPTYYLDLPEVKARCKELALAIKEILADTYDGLIEATELAHTDRSAKSSITTHDQQIIHRDQATVRTPTHFQRGHSVVVVQSLYRCF